MKRRVDIHHAINYQRSGFERRARRKFRAIAEVACVVDPGNLELRHVLLVDLVQGRIAGAGGVGSIMGPFLGFQDGNGHEQRGKTQRRDSCLDEGAPHDFVKVAVIRVHTIRRMKAAAQVRNLPAKVLRVCESTLKTCSQGSPGKALCRSTDTSARPRWKRLGR